MINGVEILHDEETLRIAAWDRVLIMRFVGAPNVDGLRRIRDQQKQLVAKVDGKVAMMSVINPKAQIKFDDEARKTSAELLNEMKANILVGTQIVVKQGFFASIVRSVMMGVNLMSKPPYPTRICANLQEGADFVAEHLGTAGHTVMPDDIVAALATALSGTEDGVASA